MRKILVAFVAILGTSMPAVPAAQAMPRDESIGMERACADPGPGRVRCHLLRDPEENRVHPMAATDVPKGLSPADLRGAYNITGNSTATVAIVAPFAYPSAESDLATYRKMYGLPECTSASGCFRKVNQSGNAAPLPRYDNGWAQEQSLDVQMVSAICATCKILLVEANTDGVDDVFASIATAARMGAKAVSNSFGALEDEGLSRYDAQLDIPGVAIVASTGDWGYEVNYPASSPHVISVGATTLSKSDGGRGWTESTWNRTGGGCSRVFDKPAWQTDKGCAGRTVADVSAVGDPRTGVAVYGPDDSGGNSWGTAGGTSASAPIIAAAIAVAGGSIDNASSLYAHATQFFDVTSGSNGNCADRYLCNAGPGYDGPTGLGTPNGTTAFGGGAAQPTTVKPAPTQTPPPVETTTPAPPGAAQLTPPTAQPVPETTAEPGSVEDPFGSLS